MLRSDALYSLWLIGDMLMRLLSTFFQRQDPLNGSLRNQLVLNNNTELDKVGASYTSDFLADAARAVLELFSRLETHRRNLRVFLTAVLTAIEFGRAYIHVCILFVYLSCPDQNVLQIMSGCAYGLV